MHLKKALIVLTMALISTGCKLTIVASSGGKIESSSGIRDCDPGMLCEFIIDDLDFSDSFTAIPNSGYIFHSWQAGIGLICGGSTNPTCPISNIAYAGVTELELAVSTGLIGYAIPIFQFVGIDTDNDGVKDFRDEDDDNDGILDADDPCPNNPAPSCGGDTITANGKVWYQADQFRGVSWDDVNQACSGGPCEGQVGGVVLNGWTWASDTDVAELFEFYESQYAVSDCPLIDGLITEGWDATDSTGFGGALRAYLAGWTSNGTSSSNSYTLAGLNDECSFRVSPGINPDEGTVGAFFYQ